MNITERLYLLTDTLLLHGCSLSSSGFYYGKSGLSFSLFCAAHYLNDSYIEEQVSELLKESLLAEFKNMDFQNGHAGIVYILAVLIQKGWIDADLFELCGEQLQEIFDEINKIPTEVTDNNFNRIDYLILLEVIKSDIQEYDKLKQNALRGINEYVLNLFENVNKKDSLYKLLCVWKHYLNVISSCQNVVPDMLLLNKYMEMYIRKTFPSSMSIGYSLQEISCFYKRDFIQKVTQQNIENDKNIHFCFCLRELLNKLTLLMKLKYNISDFVMNFFFESSNSEFEKKIIKLMRERSHRVSFYEGLAGLLYFLIYFLDPQTPKIKFIL